MKIYPNLDYHFFITASLEERIRRKSIQYENKYTAIQHITKPQSKEIIIRFFNISPLNFYHAYNIILFLFLFVKFWTNLDRLIIKFYWVSIYYNQ